MREIIRDQIKQGTERKSGKIKSPVFYLPAGRQVPNQ
jgi:hypothetical protein